MVYVDDPIETGRGRVKMSHLLADSTKELNAMAQRIGVARDAIDLPGTACAHFDLTKTQRERAIRLGAQPLTLQQLGEKIRARRTRA